MLQIKRLRVTRSLICLFLLAAVSGCSNSLSQQLLNAGPSADFAPPANSLATPPADALQVARVETNAAFVEESELPPDVPSLTELSSRPVDGIDAPKVAKTLEDDVASLKVENTVLWRGKMGANGLDLANRNGTLCSGESRSQSMMKVACSDGRIGTVKLLANSRAQIAFNNGQTETVQLEN